MMFRSTILLFLVFVPVQICGAASPQQKDVLHWGGSKFQPIEFPLEQRLKQAERSSGKNLLKPNSSTNLKGYIASWRITKKSLVLERFDGVLGDKDVSFGEVFEGESLPTKAVWFSGKLSLPVGEFDFESGRYPIILELTFDSGKLVKTKCRTEKSNATEAVSEKPPGEPEDEEKVPGTVSRVVTCGHSGSEHFFGWHIRYRKRGSGDFR